MSAADCLSNSFSSDFKIVLADSYPNLVLNKASTDTSSSFKITGSIAISNTISSSSTFIKLENVSKPMLVICIKY